MKTYLHYYITFLLTFVLLTGCSTQDETTPVSRGEADFSTFVALGNSLTAGYSNNALYYDGQVVSFPNLMAQQMKAVGGGEFKQPLVDQSSVGIGSDGNARLTLKIVDGELKPVPVAEQGDLSIFLNSVADQGPFNNMGVPGATVTAAVFPGYGDPNNGAGNFNPFFTRMTADPQNASMLSDAVAQEPTFFLVFIGNNDVLGYATNGGAQGQITPMGGGVGEGFSASYQTIISGLTANGAEGVLANIPDVTSTPFFTTVPYNGLVLEDQAKVDALNQGYAQLIDAGLIEPFELGPNNFIIEDENSPAGLRQIQKGELILLTVPQDELAQGLGSQQPIPDKYVLTQDELSQIQQATKSYNEKIKAMAEEKGLAFVDVNQFLKKIRDEGVYVNGSKITTDFIKGGAFSLDGIHLTPVANALLANKFIGAINSTYDAFIPYVETAKYGRVRFP